MGETSVLDGVECGMGSACRHLSERTNQSKKVLFEMLSLVSVHTSAYHWFSAFYVLGFVVVNTLCLLLAIGSFVCVILFCTVIYYISLLHHF